MPPDLHAGAVTGSAHGFSGHPPRGNMNELGVCICRGKAKRTWAQVATSIICTSTGTSEAFMWFQYTEMTVQLQKLHRSSCRIGRSWGRGNFIAIKGRMFAERERTRTTTQLTFYIVTSV